MNWMIRELRGAYAFVERNINLTKRYWGWEIVWLISSLVNSLAVTYIGAGMERISGETLDTQYIITYLLVGTLIWSYLSVIFYSISEMIAWERWEGTIEYTFMAPVSRLTHLVGTTLFAIGYGILRTLVILLIVAAFFRLDLSGANIGGGGLATARRERLVRRAGDPGRGSATPLPREGGADDEHSGGDPPSHLWGVLPSRHPAWLAAGNRLRITGHLRDRGNAGLPIARRVDRESASHRVHADRRRDRGDRGRPYNLPQGRALRQADRTAQAERVIEMPCGKIHHHLDTMRT